MTPLRPRYLGTTGVLILIGIAAFSMSVAYVVLAVSWPSIARRFGPTDTRPQIALTYHREPNGACVAVTTFPMAGGFEGVAITWMPDLYCVAGLAK